MAGAVSVGAAGRTVGRTSPGSAALDYRPAGGGSRHQNFGDDAHSPHPLDHAFDVGADWTFPDCHREDLERLRVATASSREFQILQGSPVRGKSAGCGWVVHESTGTRAEVTERDGFFLTQHNRQAARPFRMRRFLRIRTLQRGSCEDSCGRLTLGLPEAHNAVVRRIMAGLLVAVFSFSLIAPALLAKEDSNLPACCRRLGEHHCTLAASPGASFIQERCPHFPLGSASLAASESAAVTPAQVVFAAIVSHPAAHAQTEAHYRVSFSRAWHKRGPPALLF